jgi:DNA-binding GntR family transcriptional regulator
MNGHPGPAGADPAGPGTGVLAGRIAAMLVHHDPGWQLPRFTVLARRFGVSPAEMAAAVDVLAAQHLLRRLPDGLVYRASPADYLITLDGLAGLAAHIDPMGASIACVDRHTTEQRRIPAETGHALGLAPGEPATAIRCLWAADGHHAALTTTYLPGPLGTAPGFGHYVTDSLDAALTSGPARSDPGGPEESWHPETLSMEVRLPAASVARVLRLAPGEAAITVTVRLTGPGPDAPTAVTVAALRADLFRIIVQTAGPDPAGSRPAEGPQP